jgi:ABC-type cobalamin/Fe3+-siderophores transport system ATPase subunit
MVLDSLRIQNFKTFRDLTVERLGRVNLVVGKNNVGKTALLEALWLYAHPEFFYEVLERLDSQREDQVAPKSIIIENNLNIMRHFFHGHLRTQGQAAKVIKVSQEEDDSEYVAVRFSPQNQDTRDFYDYGQKIIGVDLLEVLVGPGFTRHDFVTSSGEAGFDLSLDSEKRFDPVRSHRFRSLASKFISSAGLFAEDAERLFADAIRANRKAPVMRALNLTTEETITDLNWIVDPNLAYRLSGNRVQVDPTQQMARIPVVAVEGRDEAVPLSALGEGTTRAMEIALALVNAKGGLLLIDEVETGLHYSVQPDLWRLIFETAAALDVQVVATTHSSDCVRAFQRMALDRPPEESQFISLRRHRQEPERVVAVLADNEEMKTILETGIEVR